MAVDLEKLIKEGIFDIELGVANPRTNGVSAGEGAIGYATDNSRWVKVGAGDTDWEQILISTNGEYIVNFELADVSGTVPDLNQLGVSGGVPSIGDGITPNGRKVMMNTKPAGYATMTSVDTAAVSLTVKQSGATGVCYSINGGTPTYVAGAVGALISLSSIVDPDGSPTDIAVWPATSATSGRVGDLTTLRCGDGGITTLNVSGLTALVYLSCYSNNLTTLDVTGLTALTDLDCYNNNLTTLDVTGLTALTDLSCSSNNLTTLDVTGLTALTDLDCYNNNLTTLDVSGLTALESLYCYSNNLTTLDVRNASSLYDLRLSMANGGVVYLGGNSNFTLPLLADFDGQPFTMVGELPYADYAGYVGYCDMDFEGEAWLDTDALYTLIEGITIPDPALDPGFINLSGCPCLGGGSSIVDGATRTAAETEALLADKKLYY